MWSTRATLLWCLNKIYFAYNLIKYSSLLFHILPPLDNICSFYFFVAKPMAWIHEMSSQPAGLGYSLWPSAGRSEMGGETSNREYHYARKHMLRFATNVQFVTTVSFIISFSMYNWTTFNVAVQFWFQNGILTEMRLHELNSCS